MPNSHVLILTGAGASTALGKDKPLVMMSEWASSLVDALGHAAGLLKLSPSMRGDEFEAALGRFIRFAEALPSIEPLHTLGGARGLIGPSQLVQPALNSQEWLNIAWQNVDLIRRALWRNLYEHFTTDHIDEQTAHTSYKRLHDLIRDTLRRDANDPVFIAHATTNFDRAIEAAIDIEAARENKSWIESRDGFTKNIAGRRAVWAPNLLNSVDQDGVIPVLHLHGAVGWYFTEDGTTLQSRASDEPIDDRLTPALLLPDDTKNVSAFPDPLRQMWDQFKQQLANCTHVLVLGHSLHDAHLVQELEASQKPIAAVAFSERVNDSYDVEHSSDAKELRKVMPGLKLIGGNFGQGAEHSDIETNELKLWLRDPTR